MKYNQWIDFNGEWASTKTVEAFIAHEQHHGLSEQELRDIHALILIEHGVQPEPVKSIEEGDNPIAQTEGDNLGKLIEHGDDTGIQKEADRVEDGGSSSNINKRNRRKPGVAKQGTDDGGEA